MFQILKFKSRVVKKEYCFEISDVPVESDYLEVRYSTKFPEVTQLEGDTFCKIFGVKTSALENLLLHKNIYGPCWLEVKAKNDINPVSWCDMNVTCEGINCIKVRTAITFPNSGCFYLMFNCTTQNRVNFVMKTAILTS